ncbi:MAG: magnesium chelatase domain-containing protein [Patescibacteria group bacterium]
MMLSTHTVFTLQTEKGREDTVVQIETLITNGLYKFTILGMSMRHASDTKDRVYSALRSNDLLNLKSDNRKIIINLSPDDTLKREGIYDLGIALSLLSCIHKDISLQKIIAVGGLTLSGKITASKRLFQAIYTAHVNNIDTIVCGEDDVILITQHERDMLSVCNINIISSHNLKDLVEKIKKQNQQNPRKSLKVKSIAHGMIHPVLDFEKLDELHRALLIALCGGHNILIQSSSPNSIKNICVAVGTYLSYEYFGEKVSAAFKHKLLDTELHESVLYIDNIKSTHVGTVIQQAEKHGLVIGTYPPCICGRSYVFFRPYTHEDKCLCSKKSILQHKRSIKTLYFDFFTIHLADTRQKESDIQTFKDMIRAVREKQFDRYITEHMLTAKEVFLFPDNSYVNEYRDITIIENSLDTDTQKLWKESEVETRTLRVAQTIQDILDLSANNSNKKPAISKQALILAISYGPRMDF